MRTKNANSPTVCTLTENEEKDGYELRFPGPVDEVWSEVLRSQGWRFNRDGWRDPRWYAKRSPEMYRKANAIVQNFNKQLEVTNTVLGEIAKPVTKPVAASSALRPTFT